MCGCCRVTVEGKVRFACVEGPMFPSKTIDFDELTVERVNISHKNRKVCICMKKTMYANAGFTKRKFELKSSKLSSRIFNELLY